MYARARGYFRAMIAVLKLSLPDEASTLGRALLDDSLRLSILAAEPDDPRRVDSLIAWALDGIKRSEHLVGEAQSLDVGTQHDDLLETLGKNRADLVAYRTRRGTGATGPYPFSQQHLKKAATDKKRHAAWWLHGVGDQMTHGNLFAHVMRHTPAPAGGTAVRITNSHPYLVIYLVAFAIESMVVSHQSVCRILGLETFTVLDQKQDEIEALQREFYA